MTNSSFLYMKILWRRFTKAEIAFGKRCSLAGLLRMTLYAGSMRSERAGFSPGASASAVTCAAASARVSRQVRYKQNHWYMVCQWFSMCGLVSVSGKI